jgi:hypothetical protein
MLHAVLIYQHFYLYHTISPDCSLIEAYRQKYGEFTIPIMPSYYSLELRESLTAILRNQQAQAQPQTQQPTQSQTP